MLMDRTGEHLWPMHEAPALFFAPFVSSRMRIEPEWIDTNGHLNRAFYQALFDRTLDEAFGLCGLGGDDVQDHKASLFVVESRIRYRQELTFSDPVRGTLHLIDFDDKRLHFVMELRHAVEGWLAATCENLSVNIDLATRQVAPIPLHILANLATMKAAHADLPKPDMVAERMNMPAKMN